MNIPEFSGSQSYTLLAHRGFAHRFPENTLSALRGALEHGARKVEFDIQLSADGVPFVIHDATLTRTCGVDGQVTDMTLIQLSDVCAGYPARFGERFAKEPLPTLAQTVALLGEYRDIEIFAEIKDESIERIGQDATLDTILPVLEALRGAVVVISFNLEIVLSARARSKHPIGWCVARYDEVSAEKAKQAKPEFLLTNYKDLPADGSALWPGPWAWVLYEVVDPDVAEDLMSRGASIIETMDLAAFST